jgi:hypothetical protein
MQRLGFLEFHSDPWLLPASDRQSVGPSRYAADSTARAYDQAFCISAFNIIIIGQPALHVFRFIIADTLWQAMKAMEQAFPLSSRPIPKET